MLRRATTAAAAGRVRPTTWYGQAPLLQRFSATATSSSSSSVGLLLSATRRSYATQHSIQLIEEELELIVEEQRQNRAPSLRRKRELVSLVAQTNNGELVDKVIARFQEAGLGTSRVREGLISAYVNAGEMDKALQLFREMRERESKGARPKATLYAVLLRGLKAKHQTGKVLSLYDDLLSIGRHPNEAVLNTLVDHYARNRQFEEANEVLEVMRRYHVRPTLATYTALMDAHFKAGDWESAVAALKNLQGQGFTPDEVTLTSLLTAHTKSSSTNGGSMKEAIRIFEYMQESGLPVRKVAYSALITGLAKAGQLKEAKARLDEMRGQGYNADHIAYSPLLSSYYFTALQGGMPWGTVVDEHLLPLWEEIREQGILLDIDAYKPLLFALARKQQPVKSLGEKDKATLNEIFGGMVMEPYIKLRDLNGMLAWYLKYGHLAHADLLWQAMQQNQDKRAKELTPDSVTENLNR
ncbi:hypothetical protein QOT17_017849 [Balamuthia mandrillaris]